VRRVLVAVLAVVVVGSALPVGSLELSDRLLLNLAEDDDSAESDRLGVSGILCKRVAVVMG
jgi:hypothetical protein